MILMMMSLIFTVLAAQNPNLNVSVYGYWLDTMSPIHSPMFHRHIDTLIRNKDFFVFLANPVRNFCDVDIYFLECTLFLISNLHANILISGLPSLLLKII